MSVEEVNNFTPPKGLDITWHDYDYYQNEVTASIVGSEWCPEDTYFVYREEDNHMLAKLKVAQDGIRSSKYPIQSVRTLNTPSNFIADTEYDRLLSKAKVNDILVNTNTLNEYKKKKKVDSKEVDQNIFKVQIAEVVL